MIAGFRDEWLRAFFVEDARSRHIPSKLERLSRKLQMIDDATSIRICGRRAAIISEAARQSGWVPLDPRQQPVAAHLSMGWPQR